MSANVTGDLFDIGDRAAGFAVGAEHREYEGEFQPDPLRATGESQDSFASPVSADYDVNELYAEVSVPLLETPGCQRRGALVRLLHIRQTRPPARSACAGSPSRRSRFAARISNGFRAPNLGELFGLTQFAATLTDPCGPTGHRWWSNDADGLNTTPLETACRAQGVPIGLRTGQHADHHIHRRQRRPAAREIGQLHGRASCTTPPGPKGSRITPDVRAHLLQPRDRQRHPGARSRGAAQRLSRGRRHRPDAVFAVHARGQRQSRAA